MFIFFPLVCLFPRMSTASRTVPGTQEALARRAMTGGLSEHACSQRWDGVSTILWKHGGGRKQGALPGVESRRDAASKGIQGGRGRHSGGRNCTVKGLEAQESVSSVVSPLVCDVSRLFPSLPQRGQSVGLGTGSHTQCKGLAGGKGQSLFHWFLPPWFQHVLHTPTDTKRNRLVPSFLILGSSLRDAKGPPAGSVRRACDA